MNSFVRKPGFPEHSAADAVATNPAPEKPPGDAPAAPCPAQQQDGHNCRQVGIHPTARKTNPYAFDVIG